MFTKQTQRGQGVVEYIAILLGVLFFVWCVAALIRSPNRITNERALPQIAQLARVSQEDIVVVHHTNYSVWVGEPYDVRYDLVINNKNVGARCTVSGWWSDMVCLLYFGAGD